MSTELKRRAWFQLHLATVVALVFMAGIFVVVVWPRGHKFEHLGAGRIERLTGWPLVEITCSPRANRVASSGPSVVPEPPASADHEVCTCSSPKYGRSG